MCALSSPQLTAIFFSIKDLIGKLEIYQALLSDPFNSLYIFYSYARGKVRISKK